MSPDEETQGNVTPGLVESEGVNAASSDPEQDNAHAGHVVSSSGAPQGATQPEDAAPEGDSLLGAPDQHGHGPGQELSAGEG